MTDRHICSLFIADINQSSIAQVGDEFLWLAENGTKHDVQFAARVLAREPSKLNVCAQRIRDVRSAKSAGEACSAIIEAASDSAGGVASLSSDSLAVLVSASPRQKVVRTCFRAWSSLPVEQRRIPIDIQRILEQRCKLTNKTQAVAAAGMLLLAGDTDLIQRTGAERLGKALRAAGAQENRVDHLIDSLSLRSGGVFRSTGHPGSIWEDLPVPDMGCEQSPDSYLYYGSSEVDILREVTERVVRSLTCDDARGDAEALNLLLECLPDSWVNVLRVVQYTVKHHVVLSYQDRNRKSSRVADSLRPQVADKALRVWCSAIAKAAEHERVQDTLKGNSARYQLQTIMAQLMPVLDGTDGPGRHEAISALPEWLVDRKDVLLSRITDSKMREGLKQADMGLSDGVLQNAAWAVAGGFKPSIDDVMSQMDASLRRRVLEKTGIKLGGGAVLLAIGLELSDDEVLDYMSMPALLKCLSHDNLVDVSPRRNDKAWNKSLGGNLGPHRDNFAHGLRGTDRRVVDAVLRYSSPAGLVGLMSVAGRFRGDNMSLREYIDRYRSLLVG